MVETPPRENAAVFFRKRKRSAHYALIIFRNKFAL